MTNSSSTLIKFPVKSFRKIFDKSITLEGSEDINNTSSIGNIYSAIVSINDLPSSISDWTDINPRDPKTKSGVSLKIRATLTDDPEWFLFKNRGLTLLVSSVDYNNKENIISLELSNKSIHGLLDGGHTFKVIQEYLEELPEKEKEGINGLIKIEILEGIDELENAVKIVEARNTSTQVKPQSIEELNHNYDPLKEALKNEFYSNNISYKEYELDEENTQKTIDIKEILSYLI